MNPYSTLKRSEAPMRRSAFGEKKRQRVMSEAQQAKVLEGDKTRFGLFQLHHIDFLHIPDVQRSQGTLRRGLPDYLLIGDYADRKDIGWSAYLEIKAFNLETGKLSSRLSTYQRDFHERLTFAGQEVWTAYLPRDLRLLNDWLAAKTGRIVNIDGLLAEWEAA